MTKFQVGDLVRIKYGNGEISEDWAVIIYIKEYNYNGIGDLDCIDPVWYGVRFSDGSTVPFATKDLVGVQT